ncbi:hypothetical protein EYC59_02990 [Candidatus Saccharibacteria bacterium]|nr:MAG: hypothetical protein EYC59_02990 [Candidatus Saccharibacteria bacterium]
MECPKCRQPVEDSESVCGQCGFMVRPERASAYAVLQPSARPKPSLELVLAVLSIPAALMPLLGFGLGVPALVLAQKHKAVLPTVLAVVGIVFSLIVLTFNLVYYTRHSEKSAAVIVVNIAGHYSSGLQNLTL